MHRLYSVLSQQGQIHSEFTKSLTHKLIIPNWSQAPEKYATRLQLRWP